MGTVPKRLRYLVRGVNDGKGHIFRLNKPVTVPRHPDIEVRIDRPPYPESGDALITVASKEARKDLFTKQSSGYWEEDPTYVAPLIDEEE